MIHILGKKQKRKKTYLSFLCHKLIPDHLPCPFLVSLMLPLWAILNPLGDGQRMKGQTTAVSPQSVSFSPLFHCSFPLTCFPCSSTGLPWAMGTLGEHLLQHGLIPVPQFLCCGAPPPALAMVALSPFSHILV